MPKRTTGAGATSRARRALFSAVILIGICAPLCAPRAAVAADCAAYTRQLYKARHLADEADVWANEGNGFAASAEHGAAVHAFDMAEQYGDLATCGPTVNMQMHYFGLKLLLNYQGIAGNPMLAEAGANDALRRFARYFSRKGYRELQYWARKIHPIAVAYQEAQKADKAESERVARADAKVDADFRKMSASKEKLVGHSCAVPNSEPAVVTPYPPETPAIAAQQGITGTVEVQVQLDEVGHIVGTPAAITGPSMLRSAAVTATKQSTFRTEVRNCVPRPAEYKHVVEFTAS